jgi:hypothetical protein
VSVLELMVPKFRGMDVRQQNVYAEFVVDGFWVDMHISKVLYKPEEHQLFERIIKAVKFEPKNQKQTLSQLSPDTPIDQPKQATDANLRKMEEAMKPYIEQAKKTYPEAKQRYLAGLPAKHVFFVTTRLHDAAGRFEQVFVEVKELKDGKIRGLIASEVNLLKTTSRAMNIRSRSLRSWTGPSSSLTAPKKEILSGSSSIPINPNKKSMSERAIEEIQNR